MNTTSENPVSGVLPWPRFRIKAGVVSDRWTGRTYKPQAGTLVALLNTIQEAGNAQAAKALTNKVDRIAGVEAAQAEAKDAYQLVKREREAAQAAHDARRAVLADLETAERELAAIPNIALGGTARAFIDRALAALRKHVSPTAGALEDNPFGGR